MIPLIADIKQAVCAHYGLLPLDMTAHRRAGQVARPRQVAMYLTRQMTERSYPEIGRHFGNRDHATVIHAVRKVEHLISTDVEIAADVLAIRGVIVSTVTKKSNALAVGDAVSGD